MTGRYGVLADGRHLAVRAVNLRLTSSSAGEPLRYDILVRKCDLCGKVGVVSSSPSLAEAARHCPVVLYACGGCREAVYCSKACQKKAWRDHKPACTVAKDARELLNAFAEDPALNAMLCERADEEADGVPRRRLIHFRCPCPATLKDLRDKPKLMTPGGVAVDVQYASADDQLDAEATGDEAAVWEAALARTKEYDVDRKISTVVSTPLPGGASLVLPAIVPRLFGREAH